MSHIGIQHDVLVLPLMTSIVDRTLVHIILIVQFSIGQWIRIGTPFCYKREHSWEHVYIFAVQSGFHMFLIYTVVVLQLVKSYCSQVVIQLCRLFAPYKFSVICNLFFSYELYLYYYKKNLHIICKMQYLLIYIFIIQIMWICFVETLEK